MSKDQDAEHGSASELLADWRTAERDAVAAHEAASVAARAVAAATAATDAAVEAETAAMEAKGAAARAADAAERANVAASLAAEAAQTAASTTEDDQAKADQTAIEADRVEGEARDRFHTAQEGGFPRTSRARRVRVGTEPEADVEGKQTKLGDQDEVYVFRRTSLSRDRPYSARCTTWPVPGRRREREASSTSAGGGHGLAGERLAQGRRRAVSTGAP